MSTVTEDEPVAVAGVTYSRAEDGYFDKRKLKRTAGFWGLWGMGVAAVISGDFSGWNGGIPLAGWGGFMLATLIVVAMYVLMVESISEMAAAMPHTGGAYSFARAAMGPWGGFITGLAETIEYVMTTAVVIYFSAQYADAILTQLAGFSLIEAGLAWVWWLGLYAIFVGLNAAGAHISFRFATVVAFLSVGVLVLFGVIAVASGTFSVAKLFDIAPVAGSWPDWLSSPALAALFPMGPLPVLFALPFAMWLFLGIEELPLAAEEAHDPERDIPRAGRGGLLTLLITGLIVVVLNPGVVGATAIGASTEPLLEGFRTIIPGDIAAILSGFALIGLLASVQGIMFAYGRNMYSLSRAGYYPKFLSLTGSQHTPYLALIVGAAIGFASLFVVQFGDAAAGSVVLNIAVWGAVVAYLSQMASYVILRVKHPEANRPHRSPFGIAGAVIAGLVAAVIFVGVLLNPAYTVAIYTVVVLYVLALIAFAVYGRHQLVLSPEEEYALSGGLSEESTDLR